jgi:DNA-binding transcriptional ArsR family regulator
MVNFSRNPLDAVFSALADPTRRAILASLAQGERPVSTLAEPFGMSLPGVMKHLRTLEEAGLVTREKEGRVVTCSLSAAPMKQAMDWLAKYEKFWSTRLDALAQYLEKEKDPWQKPQQPRNPRSRSSAASRRRPKRSGKR